MADADVTAIHQKVTQGAMEYMQTGETTMAFVNEMISTADREKYGLDLIDQELRRSGRAPQRDWTIDHERKIYLRKVDQGREDAWSNFRWNFYWQGELLTVCMQVVDSGSDGVRGGHGWVHYKLVDCYLQGFFIPEHLLGKRDEIVSDLRSALIAYRGAGVYASKSSFETTLTI